MGIVNKPEISGWLKWTYAVISILIPALGAVLAYFSSSQKPTAVEITATVVLIVVFGFVETVMLWMLVSICRTRYILSEDELVLKASLLIGGSKRVPLRTVISAEVTLIPLGFRLFGASFYGGYYYFPSIGRAFVVMTNFRDAVLIRTKHGNYLITPSNPERFIENIEKMRSQD